MQKKDIYLVDSPLYKLAYVAKVCQRSFSQFFKENCSCYGVTEGENALMDTIIKYPEISQIELARLLFKGRSHITLMLNSLKKRELIKRECGVRNGRKISKTILTAKGIKIHDKIKEICRKKFVNMCDYFEKKEDVFVNMLTEIQDILTEGEIIKFD